MLWLFLLAACQSDLELPPGVEGTSDLSAFNVRAAEAYFEANAHDLALLRFRDSVPIPTRAGVSAELIPEWDKAIHSVCPEVSLVEIPVRSNAVSVFMEKNFRDGRAYSAQSISTFRRLMVARRADGHTDMFVVTVLPGAVKQGQKIDENIRNFRYLGGSGFNGRVFCSTLDGRFVEAWQYVDGERSRLAVTTRRHLQEQGDDLSSGEYQSLSLLNGITTRAGTYWDNETGGSGSGYCQFHPQYAASACPYCLDEVIVRECQWCHRTLSEGENCYCRCSWCGYSPCRCCFYCHSYPCRCGPTVCTICLQDPCTKCTRCGSHYCLGVCGSSGGSGGGGGSGSGNSGSDGRVLANAIFNLGSALTSNQWNKLENALENINNDCMGGLLLGVSKNKNIMIVHDVNIVGNGSYNYGTNTLKIKDFEEADIIDKELERVLFHELLHSQQVFKQEAKMNREIEVWIATFRYAVKHKIDIENPKYGNIRILSEYAIDSKYNITDQSLFDVLYEKIVTDFKADLHYQTYQESPADRNLNTATRIGKDC